MKDASLRYQHDTVRRFCQAPNGPPALNYWRDSIVNLFGVDSTSADIAVV